ncbi:MAG: hypothetical protein U0R44_03415 [Candidatus Micrarchaeia archaeon]
MSPSAFRSAMLPVILLALMPLVHPTAPAWVAAGVSLNYSVGSSAFTFIVLNRTSTDVRLQIQNHSSSKLLTPTENASADYGQFWFDSSKLSGAQPGGSIGDFSVSETNKQTFAGKEWDTVTLTQTLGNSEMTKILDLQTGILLKQTVNAPGAPVVMLQQYYIPSLAPPPPTPPPAQPPANTTQHNATPSPQPPSNPPAPPPKTRPPLQSSPRLLRRKTLASQSNHYPNIKPKRCPAALQPD